MKINNFQIMMGPGTCNANCKFCISRITYPIENNGNHLDRLYEVEKLAKQLGITTATITGKGEPTLEDPSKLLLTIKKLAHTFSMVELQTNGLDLTKEIIKEYYRHGLTTISLSRCHFDNEINNSLMGIKQNQPLEEFQKIDFPICKRMSITLCKGYIDNKAAIMAILNQCKAYGFQQLTLHPIGLPKVCKDNKVKEFIKEHELSRTQLVNIESYLKFYGYLIYKFPWGGKMYSVNDITVVMGYCLDRPEDRERGTFHSLILGCDGHIRLSWEHKGSVIM